MSANGGLTVERFDGGNWSEITYRGGTLSLETGVHKRLLAPRLSFEVSAQNNGQAIPAGERLRVKDPGGNVFADYLSTVSRGKYGPDGARTITAEHDAYAFFDESVTLDNEVQSASDHIDDVQVEAENGFDWLIDYNGPDATFEYEAKDVKIREIFRDIMEIDGSVFVVALDEQTITVEDSSTTWQSIDTQADPAALVEWEPGLVDSVTNRVTVVPSGGEGKPVQAVAEDQNSIDEFGVRSEVISIRQITEQSAADDVAQNYLQPTPDDAGTLRLVGDVLGDGTQINPYQSLANRFVELTDDTRDVQSEQLLIEKQTIENGQQILEIGGGGGEIQETAKRSGQSTNEQTEPGTIMPTDRIADDAVTGDKVGSDAIDTDELADRAIVDQKVALSGIIAENLADSAVERAKIAQAAINGDKVETGTLGATKLFIEDWIPIGLEFREGDAGEDDFDGNPLASDEIAWNEHSIVFEGSEYDILADVTNRKYTYFSPGFGYISTDSKPDLDDDEALVVVNDPPGVANQILQATSIHGGAIRTGSIEAAEISSGTITADLIDVLNLNAGEFSVTDDPANPTEGIEIDLDSTGTVSILPVTNEGARLGQGNNDRFLGVATSLLDAETVLAAIGPTTGAIRIEDSGSQNLVQPQNDSGGSLGTDSNSFNNVWAYNYFDANTGSTINDGGDPLAGLTNGHGPPEHAKRYDDDGEVAGYSLNEMARSVWDVCREQERIIEDQQDRIDDLETRLEKLEEHLTDGGANGQP
jgi:hypothetical protein